MALTAYEELCRALEAERNDLSYRQPPKSDPVQPIVVVQKVTKSLEKKQAETWYHAGRFAAGARDEIAVKANAAAKKLAGQA